MTQPDRVLIGRVRRAHGVRGELLVEPLTDVPDRFVPGTAIELRTRDGRALTSTVASCRGHRLGLLVGLADCTSRERAETLRGAEIEVPRSQSPAAPEGAFYYYELHGCRCNDRRHGPLGRVREVLEDGGGLLLRVGDGDRAWLVPFVNAYLVEVDRARGVIELDLPDGLLETCEST